MSLIQTQQTEKDLIIKNNTEAFNFLKSRAEASFKLVNMSKDVDTLLESFGKDGITLFTGFAKVVEVLKFFDPTYTPPASSRTYKFNKDGTVTVEKPAEVKE